MKLYPLKFNPIFKKRIWGGNKLKTDLNKNFTQNNIGESWEISDIEGDESVVANGCYKSQTLKQLIEKFKGKLVGDTVYEQFGNNFPLLIKFIDAHKPLSVQVHPNDNYAKINHNSLGKNELWYIINAEENAKITIGFKEVLNENVFHTKLKNNTVMETLNIEEANSGDVFYIPTGRVHAIGAGVLLAEIQQTSDITYRVYDYNRINEETGKKRELHINKALDVINYNDVNNFKTPYKIEENATSKLVHSPYFKTNILHVTKYVHRNLSKIDSFKIYMCVEGKATYLYNNHSG
ncbi:MAG TPA: type I phosphomannose isomerase catalytic subunit, partial [Flavobacteriaceae bacterium]|nr:type I phosphomannose isomerase catalytic subunit [Flavobacteriaceae bacterium]